MTAVDNFLLTPVLFETIKEELPEYQNEIKNIKAIVLYEITKNGQPAGKWTMDFKSSPVQIYEGEPRDGAKPTVSVTIDDQDFVAIAAGELDPVKAFLSGEVRAKGNIMLMQKLSMVMKNARLKAML